MVETCMTLSSRVVNQWNDLPAEVGECTTEAELKPMLDSYSCLEITDCCKMCNISAPHRSDVLSHTGMQVGGVGADEVFQD